MKKCFIGNGGFMVHCNKDCEKCKQLNVKDIRGDMSA